MKTLLKIVAIVLLVGGGLLATRPGVEAQHSPAAHAVASVAKTASEEHVALADAARKHVVQVLVERRKRPKPGGGGGHGGGDETFFDLSTGPYSGVIVGAEGEILICDTILGQFVGADRQGKNKFIKDIYVTFEDGRTLTAEIKGRSRKYDLALLKVNAKDLPAVPLESFRAPRRGETVNVITRSLNPMRVGMNSGVCSAESREEDLAWQIDARCGACDLGGLVTSQTGEPLGLVGFFEVKRVGQASGVAYAARDKSVRAALTSLRAGEFVPIPPKPFLGVGAEALYADKPGLQVSNVVAGSGAARVGIKENDVLLKAEDEDLMQVSDMKRVIAAKKVGETLKLLVLRKGEGADAEKTMELYPILGTRD